MHDVIPLRVYLHDVVESECRMRLTRGSATGYVSGKERISSCKSRNSRTPGDIGVTLRLRKAERYVRVTWEGRRYEYVARIERRPSMHAPCLARRDADGHFGKPSELHRVTSVQDSPLDSQAPLRPACPAQLQAYPKVPRNVPPRSCPLEHAADAADAADARSHLRHALALTRHHLC